jgi:soluble epoxide hydrolase / lipid-phosphate phosphatase
MNDLERKSITVDGGLNYTYYTTAPRNNLPTVLLLHGCPDTASLWSNVVTAHIVPAGYGVLAPDLLGYGDTDKPTDLQQYGLPSICRQVLSILDHEKRDKFVVLGHDFGAMLASKLCIYHPDRVAGLITLGTAFIPPSPYPFNFEQVKAMQEQYQGYRSSWYFPLFISDRGAGTIDSHLEQMFTLLHGGGQRMKEVLCVEYG